jgi:hypothetical protein
MGEILVEALRRESRALVRRVIGKPETLMTTRRALGIVVVECILWSTTAWCQMVGDDSANVFIGGCRGHFEGTPARGK